MSTQNYASHRRWVPLYHFFLSTLVLAITIGATINLYKSSASGGFYSASLLFASGIALILLFLYSRTFALRAQDRAIRAEENFRHFVLTGKPLDSRVTMRQIIGLRFASDEEFVDLARDAAEKGSSEDAIKKAIKNWRADNHRA